MLVLTWLCSYQSPHPLLTFLTVGEIYLNILISDRLTLLYAVSFSIFSDSTFFHMNFRIHLSNFLKLYLNWKIKHYIYKQQRKELNIFILLNLPIQKHEIIFPCKEVFVSFSFLKYYLWKSHTL